MKWFKHDSDANMDAKLQEIMLDYGLEGYGLYWYCVELIAQRVNKENITFELEHDCRIIARNTGSTPKRIEQIMTSFINLGLFNANNGHVFCLKLAQRCDDFTAKIVRRSGQKIDKTHVENKNTCDSGQKTNKNSQAFCGTQLENTCDFDQKTNSKNDKTVINQSVGVSPSLSDKVPLEVEVEVEVEVDKKKIKTLQKIERLSLIQATFEHWWKLYPASRRVDKSGCNLKWESLCKKLTEDEIENLVNTLAIDITKKLESCEDLKYYPQSKTYLNQTRWEDGK